MGARRSPGRGERSANVSVQKAFPASLRGLWRTNLNGKVLEHFSLSSRNSLGRRRRPTWHERAKHGRSADSRF